MAIEESPMKNYLTEDQIYARARKKAKAIRGFYWNLLCYCIVIPVLIIINLVFTPDFYWFLFSACGWGIGLLFHSMGAFGYFPFLGQDWEERKIKEFMDKDKAMLTQNKFQDGKNDE